MTQKVTVAFLEVGQGDSIVITYPDGITASIIDTPDSRVTFDYLVENNIRFVDWAIVSHGDSDHYNGITTLINNLHNEGIGVTKLGYIRGDKNLKKEKGYNLLRQQFVRFQDEFGIETIAPYSNNLPIITDIDNMQIHCLYPCNNADVDSAGDEPNNWSIVLMVEYLGKKVLLPGDLEGHGWFRLRNYGDKKGFSIKAEVMKLPHHGRWFSGGPNAMSLDQVIDMVSASINIVSAGYSKRLSCPSKETVDVIKDPLNSKRLLCTGCGTGCHDGEQIINIPESIKLGKFKLGHRLPCAGTITVELSRNAINILPTEEDHDFIKSRLTHPMCMTR